MQIYHYIIRYLIGPAAMTRAWLRVARLKHLKLPFLYQMLVFEIYKQFEFIIIVMCNISDIFF